MSATGDSSSWRRGSKEAPGGDIVEAATDVLLAKSGGWVGVLASLPGQGVK